MKNRFLFLLILLLGGSLFAQDETFTHADSLRGMLTPFRTCYDVTYYDLFVGVNEPLRSVSGYNTIYYKVVTDFQTMQIDLFADRKISRISSEGKDLKFRRDANAVFVDFPEMQKAGSMGSIRVDFGGVPIEAKMPPWDGGFVWKQDKNGKPWIGVACEGIGASLWWPLKDHLSDEPDSMSIHVWLESANLDGLVAVANGQLRGTHEHEKGGKVYDWFVSYPINSYNVTVNIADYAHLHDVFQNASGTHDLDYYVLSYNAETAKAHFKQVGPMMKCYEKYFGEYPFWRDGYALVETSYWGMEHQGAVAYGNNYRNNQFGWDYIIIHETGHEWWGNHVSCSDHAELWIHESFCTYSEAVYMECTQGYDKMIEYLRTQRSGINNKKPIVGPLNVNYEKWGDSDMYFKGTWMLHTLRSLINDDDLWFSILLGIQEKFGMQQIHTADITNYIESRAGRNFGKFFEQYLYHGPLPKLEYKLKKKGKNTVVQYRWTDVVKGFDMPVGVFLGDNKYGILSPTESWQTLKVQMAPTDFKVDRDKYYVFAKQL
ncbi:MAG: M1 family metallopeptidase [Bacteroidia bacterium]|nr:M1 family metallopeptidase [Bacteroidia bacterium]